MTIPTESRPEFEPWPADGLERTAACPVCEDPRRRLLYVGLRDRVFGCAPGDWTLHRCLGCRSAYLDPRPTPATLSMAYSSYYTHADAPRVRDSLPRRIWHALSAGYLNRTYGLSFPDSSRVGAVVLALTPSMRRNAERRVRHLRLPHAGARLLDVGCGSGEFVAEAGAGGWDAVGLDVDAAAIAGGRAAGRPVSVGEVGDGRFPDCSFDAVTLSHVIEHVHDPRAVLASCAAALRPGGRIWVATPDLASFGHDRFARDWLHLDPPRHLVLFTVDSLRRLMKQVGLEDVRVVHAPSTARTSFAASEALRAGTRPFDRPTSSTRVRASALLADARTRIDRKGTEEMILTARRARG